MICVGDHVFVTTINHSGATVVALCTDKVQVRWFDARDGGWLTGWFGLAEVERE